MMPGQHIFVENNTEAFQELLQNEMKDMLWAAQAIRPTLHELIRNATQTVLVLILKDYLHAAATHENRLMLCFDSLGRPAIPVRSTPVARLMEEAEKLIRGHRENRFRDAAVIHGALKIARYLRSSYAVMKTFAELLEYQEVATLCHETMADHETAEAALVHFSKDIDFQSTPLAISDHGSQEAIPAYLPDFFYPPAK
jgi:ferritin-like metal-binding protein YciE